MIVYFERGGNGRSQELQNVGNPKKGLVWEIPRIEGSRESHKLKTMGNPNGSPT